MRRIASFSLFLVLLAGTAPTVWAQTPTPSASPSPTPTAYPIPRVRLNYPQTNQTYQACSWDSIFFEAEVTSGVPPYSFDWRFGDYNAPVVQSSNPRQSIIHQYNRDDAGGTFYPRCIVRSVFDPDLNANHSNTATFNAGVVVRGVTSIRDLFPINMNTCFDTPVQFTGGAIEEGNWRIRFDWVYDGTTNWDYTIFVDTNNSYTFSAFHTYSIGQYGLLFDPVDVYIPIKTRIRVEPNLGTRAFSEEEDSLTRDGYGGTGGNCYRIFDINFNLFEAVHAVLDADSNACFVKPDGSPHVIDYNVTLLGGGWGSTQGVYTYTWDFGDGTPAAPGPRNPNHTYPAPGTYITTVKIESSYIGQPGVYTFDICEKVLSKQITIFPVADFNIVTDTTTCWSGSPVQLNFTFPITGGVPDYNISIDFEYNGVLFVSDVNYKRSGTFSTTWTYGTPGIKTVAVLLKDHSPGRCERFKTLTFELRVGPDITFTYPAPVCLGNDNAFAVNFVSPGSGDYSYAWDFDYLGIMAPDAFVPNPTYTFLTEGPGQHVIRLEVTDNVTGCVDSYQRTITVNDTPNVTISASPDAWSCSGETFAFGLTTVGGTGPFSYEWDFDYDFNTFTTQATGTTSTHNYTASGTYVVAVRTSDSGTGCEIIDIRTVEVIAEPDVTVFTNEPVCSSSPLFLHAEINNPESNGLYFYEWTVVETGDQAFTQDAFFNLPAGTYTIQLRVEVDLPGNRYCETNLTIADVDVLDAPTVSLQANGQGPQVTVCTGNVVDFNAIIAGGSGNFEITWDFLGNGNYQQSVPANQTQTSYTYSTAGIYNAKVQVYDRTSFCPPVLGGVNIDVRNAPSVAFSADKNATCNGVPITFTSNVNPPGGNYAYQWDFSYLPGDGFQSQSTDPNPSYNYETEPSGKQVVRLLVYDLNLSASCSSYADLNVYIQGVPAYIANDSPACIDLAEISFSVNIASPSLYNYEWDFNYTTAFTVDMTTTDPYATFDYSTAGFPAGIYKARARLQGGGQVCNTVLESRVVLYPELSVQSFTASPNPSCAGTEITFNVNFSGGSGDFTYAWDFDGDDVYDTINFAPSAKYTYLAEGTYQAKVTIHDNNVGSDTTRTFNLCQKDAYTTVEIESAIVPVLTQDGPLCWNTGSAINFTATFPFQIGLIYTYTWDFTSDGNPDTLPGVAPPLTSNVSYNYAAEGPGTYTVTINYTAIDTLGGGVCSGGTTIDVEVYPPVVAGGTSTNAPVCDGDPANFSPGSTNGGSGVYSYAWDFTNDGTFDSFLAAPSYTYPGPGTYTVRFRATTTGKGCSDSNTFPLVVRPLPDLNFTASPTDLYPYVCRGVVFDFQAVVAGSQSSYTYDWDFDGDGFTDAIVPNPSGYVFQSLGDQNVTLTVTEVGTLCANSLTKKVLVEGVLPFSISAPTNLLCDGESIQFSITGFPNPDPALTITWDFGDGSPTVTDDWAPIHAFPVPTVGQQSYTVSAVITQISTGCTGSQSYIIRVQERPLISNFTNNSPICDGSPAVFSYTLTWTGNPATLSYLWEWGDGSPDETTANPTHLYPGPGEYNVTFTVTDSFYGCSSTATSHVSVIDGNQLNAFIFYNPIILCWGTGDFTFTVSASGGSGAYDYYWDFNIGEACDISNFVAQDSGSPVQYGYQAEGPLAQSTIFCAAVRVVDRVTGCFGYGITQVPVEPAPEANPAAIPANICFGDFVHLYSNVTGGSGSYSYEWDFTDDGSTDSNDADPSFPSALVGLGWHTARVRVSDNFFALCTDEKTIDYFVDVGLDVTAANNSPVCYDALNFITLTGTVSGGTGDWNVTWDFQDDGVIDASTYVASYNYFAEGPGIHRAVFRAVDKNNGCYAEAITLVRIKKAPLLSLAQPFPRCDGEKVDFDLAVIPPPLSDYNFQWDFETDGTWDAFGPDANTIYPSPGTYQVTVRVTAKDGGCFNQVDRFVLVNLLPIAHIVATTPVCRGDVTDFNAVVTVGLASEYTYEWDWEGDGAYDLAGQKVSYIYPTFGTFDPVLRVTNKSTFCSQLFYKSVDVLPAPDIDVLSNDSPTCLTAPVHFHSEISGGSSNYKYEWRFQSGGSFVISGADTNHTYSSLGTFTATLRVTDNASGCVRSKNIQVQIVPTLTVLASDSSPVCFGTPVEFFATVDGRPDDTFNFAWDFDFDGVTFTPDIITTDKNTSYNYLTDTPPFFKQAKVVASALDGSCSGEATMLVQVRTTTVTTIQTFPDPAVVCEGDPVSFDAIPSGDPPTTEWTYAWDFEDDGTADNLNSHVDYIYPGPGTFTVRLTIDVDGASGCESSDTVTVIVNPRPQVRILTNSPVCTGQISDFNSVVTSGTAPFTFQWDFDYDGSTFTVDSTEADPNFVYTTVGLYDVRLRVTDSKGCFRESQSVMVVGQTMSVNIVYTTPQCKNVPVTYDAVPIGGSGVYFYEWDFTYNGSTFLPDLNYTGNHVDYLFAAAGDFTTRLRVIDASSGCSIYEDVGVTIKSLSGPVITAPDYVCYGESAFMSGSVTAGSGGGYNYSWDYTSDGIVDLAGSQAADYNYGFEGPGSYTITLSVYDINYQCTDSSTKDIEVFAVPTATIVTDTEVCSNERAYFSALATGGSGTYAYAWDIEDDGSVESTTKDYNLSLAIGSHPVRLTVTDAATGCQVFDTTSVEVQRVPDFTVTTNSPICTNIDGSFTIFIPTGTLPPYNYRLDFTGDGTWDYNHTTSATTEIVTHDYTSEGLGNYLASIQVRDARGCSVLQTTNIGVGDAPIVTATVLNPQACELNPVFFQGSATGGTGNYAWFWDVTGDGLADRMSQDTNYTYSAEGPGFYSVTLQVVDLTTGCTGSDTIGVQITSPHSVSIAHPPTSCLGGNVLFDSTVSGGSSSFTYEWDFNEDGLVDSTKADGNYTYITEGLGTYTVTLQVVDTGNFDCATLTTTTITIFSDINFVLTDNGPVYGTQNDCTGMFSQATPFTISITPIVSGGGSDMIYQVDWTNDGFIDETWLAPRTSPTQRSYSYNAEGPGTYTVLVRAYDPDAGCYGTHTTTAEVIVPEASQTNDGPICVKQSPPYSGTYSSPLNMYGSASGGYYEDLGDYTITDNTSGEFNAGNFFDTFYNGSSGAVELDTVGRINGSGTYLSTIHDAGGTFTWDSLTWQTSYPAGKELPDNQAQETAYSTGNADMSGNLLLAHLNESAGSTSFTDSSGNGSDGSCTNCPTAGVAAKLGTGLDFNASNQEYVDFDPTAVEANVTNKLTVLAWTRVDSTSGPDHHPILWKGTQIGWGANFLFRVAVRSGSGSTRGVTWGVTYGGTERFWNAGSVTLGQWALVAMTYDGSLGSNNGKAYINGQYVSPSGGSDDGPTASLNLKVGEPIRSGFAYRSSLSEATYLDGAVDEIAVYNRILSATEIRDIYLRGINRVKFQVRACDDASCSGESFAGPDGSASTYYSELMNATTGMPSLTILNQPPGRYIQYQAFFETDHASYTPELDSVTLNGSNGFGTFSYQWNVYDLGGATPGIPVATYNTQDATYNYPGNSATTLRTELTVTENGTSFSRRVICDDVTVYAELLPDFTRTPSLSAVCKDQVLNFTDTTTGGSGNYSYEWDFNGDGATDSTVANPTHAYTSVGTYSVTLKVTDNAANCSATSQPRQIVVGNTLVFTASAVDDRVCYGEPIQLTTEFGNDPSVQYRWDLIYTGTFIPDVTVAQPNWENPAVFPYPAYPGPGTYTARVLVQDPLAGCSGFANVSYTVEPMHSTTITDTAPSQCLDVPVQFKAEPNPSLAPGTYHYNWDFDNDGNPDPGYTDLYDRCATFTFTPVGSGNRTVNLFVYQPATDCTATASITHNALPVPDLNPAATTPGCVGSAMTFASNLTGGAGPFVYAWDLNYTGVFTTDASTPNVSYAYTADGNYTVRLQVTDQGTGCFEARTLYVRVYDNPVPSILHDAPKCDGNAINFTGSATSGTGNYTYSWNWGETPPVPNDSGTNPSHTFAGPGTYTVTLTVTDSVSGCTGMTTALVTTHPNASLSVSPATSAPYCHQVPVTFDTSISSGTAPFVYDWNFNYHGGTFAPMAGYSSSSETFDFTALGPGTYTVAVRATDSNSCRSNVATTTISVLETPDGMLSSNGPIQAGVFITAQFQVTNLTPVLGSFSFLWDLNDDGTFGGLADIGNGGNATDNPIRKTGLYPVPGTYQVRVRVTNDLTGCQVILTGSIVVVASLPVTIITTEPVCYPNDISFQGNVTGGTGTYTWNWDVNWNGFTHTTDFSIQNFLYNYGSEGPGTYTVRLIVTETSSGSQGSATANGVDSYDAPYIINAASNSPQCNTNPVAFTLTFDYYGSTANSNADILWDFGDSTTSTAQNPTHTYAPGDYNVTVTVTDRTHPACSDTRTFQVTQWDTPVITAISNSTQTANVCNGTAVTFSSTVTGGTPPYTFSWTFGDGVGTSAQQNPTYTYGAAGNYTATLIVTDDNGCQRVATTPVVIRPNPNAVITVQGLACASAIVGFSGAASNGGTPPYTYEWDFDYIAPTFDVMATGVSPTYTFPSQGTYVVALRVTDFYGCQDLDTQTITIYPPLILDIASNSPVCWSSNVNFTSSVSGGSGNYTIQWDFTNNGSWDASGNTVSYNYLAEGAGFYTVVALVTDNIVPGCTNTDTIVIETRSAPVVALGAMGVRFNCPSNPFDFNATATTLSNPGYSGGYVYDWNFNYKGGGTFRPQAAYTGVGANISYAFNTPGTKKVAVRARDNLNCTSSAVTLTVTVWTPPLITDPLNGQPNSFCQGQSTTLSVEAGPGSAPIDRFEWDFTNDGTIELTHRSTGCNFLPYSCPFPDDPDIAPLCDWSVRQGNTTSEIEYNYMAACYPVTGDLNAVVWVIDTNGCRTRSIVRLTMSNPVFHVDIVVQTTEHCTSKLVPYHARLEPPNPPSTRFSWDFNGDGVWDWVDPERYSTPDINWIYTEPGTYNVYVQAWFPSGCRVTGGPLVITVKPSPNLDYLSRVQDYPTFDGFGNEIPPCPLEWSTFYADMNTAVLKQGTPPYTWYWDMQNNGTTDFTNNNSNLTDSVRWYPGTALVPGPGNATIPVKVQVVDSEGCDDTIVGDFVWQPLTQISLTTNSPVCNGQPLTARFVFPSGHTGAVAIDWTSDGTYDQVLSGNDFTFSTTNYGGVGTKDFSYIFIDYNDGCYGGVIQTRTYTILSQIISTPATVDGLNATCTGTSYSFTANNATGGVGPYTYQWDFNYTGVFKVRGTGQNVSTTYNTPGTKVVALRVSDNGDPTACVAFSTLNVTVLGYPMITGSSATDVCTNGIPNTATTSITVNLTTVPAYGTIRVLWDWNGDGSSVDQTTHAAGTSVVNRSHAYPTAGARTAAIRITYDALYPTVTCYSVENVPVYVGQEPEWVNIVAASPGTDTCFGNAHNLHGQVYPAYGNYAYLWEYRPSSGGSYIPVPGGTDQNLTYVFPGGSWTVRFTVTDATNTNCSDDDTQSINVRIPLANPVSGPSNSNCNRERFRANISNMTSPYLFEWDYNNDGIVDDTVSSTTSNQSCYWNWLSGESDTDLMGVTDPRISTFPYDYNAAFTVTDGEGCSISGHVQGTLYAVIDATITAPSNNANFCVNDSVTFTGAATGGNGIYSYFWTIDSVSYTGQTVNVSWPSARTGISVQLRVEDSRTRDFGSNHCQDNASSIIINVRAPSTASASNNGPTCPTRPVQLTGSYSSSQSPYAFEWDVDNDGSVDYTTQNPTHTYADPGNYTARFRVINGYNCPSAWATTTVQVLQPVNVVLQAPSVICLGDAAYLAGSLNPNIPGSWTYEWDFHYNGSTFNLEYTGQFLNYTYLATGTYTIYLRVTNPVYPVECYGNATKVVTIYSKPMGTPVNSASSLPGACVPAVVDFNLTSVSGGTGSRSYLWDFTTDGTLDAFSRHTTYTYNSAGTGVYTATYYIYDTVSGCYTTGTTTVNLTDYTADFSSNTPVCLGTAMAFSGSVGSQAGSATSGTFTYQWDFSYNGSTFNVEGSGTTPTFTYGATGTYAVRLRVTHSPSGCVRYKDRTVQVTTPHSVSMVAPPYICLGDDISLFASVSGGSGSFSYSWRVDGGSYSSGSSNKTYSNLTLGFHTVDVQVTDNSRTCVQGTSYTFEVRVKPTGNAINSGSTCPGVPVLFSVDPVNGSYEYTWDFNKDGNGDAFTSSATYSFSSPGTYDVNLTIYDPGVGCSSYRKSAVTIVSPFTVSAISVTPSSTQCLDATFNFTVPTPTDGVAPYVFEWDFSYNAGQGFQVEGTGQNVSWVYSTSGSYTARVRITDSTGCSNTRNRTVTVRPLPTTQISTNLDACLGVSHAFTAVTSGGTSPYTHQWDFSYNGVTFNVEGTGNPAYNTFNTAGSYVVRLRSTDSLGCSNYHQVTVTVHPNLTASITGPSIGCVAVPLSFSATGGNGSGSYRYLWDIQDDGSYDLNGQFVNITYNQSPPVNYTLRLKVEDRVTGCFITTTKALSIYANPQVNLASNGTQSEPICIDLNAVITATVSGGTGPYSYVWDWNYTASGFTADHASGSDNVVEHHYTTAHDFTVAVLVTDSNNCSTLATVGVKVITGINVSITTPVTVSCDGVAIQFFGSHSGTSAPVTYYWDFNYTNTFTTDATGRFPLYSYSAPGQYKIAVRVVDNKGCTGFFADSAPRITIYGKPAATLQKDKSLICFGENIYFNAVPGGGSGAYTYAWDMSYNGTTFIQEVTDKNFFYSWASEGAGNYTVRLRVKDAISGSCYGEDSTTVTVKASPQVVVKTTSPKCVGDTVDFNATVTGGSGSYTYSWVFGDGGTATGKTTSYVYPGGTSGSPYNGSVTVADTLIGCTTVKTFTVVIFPALSVTIGNSTATQPACVNPVTLQAIVNFNSDASGGGTTSYTFKWDFNYTGVFTVDSSSEDPTYTYTLPANYRSAYTAALLVTASTGCTKFQTTTVNLDPPITGNFSINPNPPVCYSPGTTMTFSAVASGGTAPFTYEWNWKYNGVTFVRDDIGQIRSVVEGAVFGAAGTYTTALRVTDVYGCVGALVTKTVTLNSCGRAAVMTAAESTTDDTGTDEGRTLTKLVIDWLSSNSSFKRILFDQHFLDYKYQLLDERYTPFSKLREMLVEDGYEVSSYDCRVAENCPMPLYLKILKQYDVIILPAPKGQWNPEDKEALQRYVDGGGSVLALVGLDSGVMPWEEPNVTMINSINQISEMFDIEVNKDLIVHLLDHQSPATPKAEKQQPQTLIVSQLADVGSLLKNFEERSLVPSVSAGGNAVTIQVIPDADATLGREGATSHKPHSLGIWEEPPTE